MNEGEPASDVDLDVDRLGRYPDQREGAGERKHGATVAPAALPPGARMVTLRSPNRCDRRALADRPSARAMTFARLAFGRRAEQLVATRLERSGWRIVARNAASLGRARPGRPGRRDSVRRGQGGRTGATFGPERPAHAVGRRKQPAAAARASGSRSAAARQASLAIGSTSSGSASARMASRISITSAPRSETRSSRRPHRARRDRAVNRRRGERTPMERADAVARMAASQLGRRVADVPLEVPARIERSHPPHVAIARLGHHRSGGDRRARASPSTTGVCSSSQAGSRNPSTRRVASSWATACMQSVSAARFETCRPKLSIALTERTATDTRVAARITHG